MSVGSWHWEFTPRSRNFFGNISALDLYAAAIYIPGSCLNENILDIIHEYKWSGLLLEGLG